MWILIVLTTAGGYSTPHTNLAGCTRSMLAIETSHVREAYCMDVTRDKIYYVLHGKVVGLE